MKKIAFLVALVAQPVSAQMVTTVENGVRVHRQHGVARAEPIQIDPVRESRMMEITRLIEGGWCQAAYNKAKAWDDPFFLDLVSVARDHRKC